MAKDVGSTIPQYLAALSANLVTWSGGSVLGWTSPTLPKLRENDSFVTLSDEEGSWIGCLTPLGAAIGPFPGGILADVIGRKWTMLLLVIPLVISWSLIMTAELVQSKGMIYIGRLIGGFAVGAVYTVAPMYCGEIAEDNVRGALGSLLSAMIILGLFYVYVIGPFVSYQLLCIACIAIVIAFAISFFFMPESPYLLLKKGKTEEASKALQWLRHKSEQSVASELEKMKVSVEKSKQQAGKLSDLFATRGNRMALCLTWGLVAGQQLSGINTILFYTTDIFLMSGGSLKSELSTICVGGVMLLFAFLTPYLVERLGRKPLLYISGTGMCLALMVLGTFFFLKEQTDADLSSVGWVPVSSLVFYIAVYAIGYGALPWAVMGEIFPENIKGIASASSASFCWTLGFLITKFFQNVVNLMGSYTAFWIFAGFCMLANVFVFFLLPETKGKSLEEIQDILNKKQ